MTVHPYIRLFVDVGVPDVTFDSDNGYEVGDRIVNVGGSIYDCTDDSVGAAVWEEVISGSAVIEDAINNGEVTKAPTENAVFDALALKIPTSYLDTDGTLAANSDAKIASQKATKTYVDAAVTGLWDYKGATDCSSNPNYPAALKSDVYVVSVAGKIGGASGKSVDVGDVYVASADNAGGTEASVGASWNVIEHNLVGALLSANNLSDLANTSTARSNLGVAIGSQVQAWDADLDAIAGLSPSNDDVIQRKAGSWVARTIAQLVTDIRVVLDAIYTDTTHDHTGGDGATLKGQWAYVAHGLATSVPASTTWYMFMGSQGISVLNANTPVPIGGTLKNFRVRCVGTQPASGSLVFTILDAGTPTSLVITIAAGSTTNTFSDLVHTHTHVAGDAITIQAVNNATAASIDVRGGSVIVEFDITP